MTLAITGSTGFVGQGVLDALERQGREVRALARKIPDDKRNHIEWVRGDLSDKGALAALCDGASAVIHIAGLTNTPDVAEFEKVNVTGTLNLVEAAVAANRPRFVQVSSLSAREPQLSKYGASKRRAEKVVSASGLDWTIVRPPAVYGPREKDIFELFRAAKFGVVPVPPPGRSSLIHVDDLAELLIALVPGGEDVTHKVFEPDDGRKGGWTHREMARLIGWTLGRRPMVPHLSKNLLEYAAKADRFLRRDKAKLTEDRVGYMTHPDWTVSADHAVPPQVWRPRIGTREGMKTTADWYRKQGWL